MPATEFDARFDAQDEAYTLPSLEALLAGTLALMTGYAQATRDCPHRVPMAHKLLSNLQCLSAHPQFTPAMQVMVANLRTRWQLELETAAAQTRPTPLWHAVPSRLQ